MLIASCLPIDSTTQAYKYHLFKFHSFSWGQNLHSSTKDKMTNKNKNCFRYINTTQLIVRHKLLLWVLSFFLYLFFWINIGISNREIYGRRNSLHLLPVNKSMKKNRADGDIPHKVIQQSLNYGPQNWFPHISATCHFSKEDTNTNASTVIISIDRCGWDTYVEI